MSDDTLRDKIREVFEEGWFAGASGVESLPQSWGESEARAFASRVVPLPAALFVGGAVVNTGDVVLLVDNRPCPLTGQELERYAERIADFGDSVGVRFVLIHGAHIDAVVTHLRGHLERCAAEARDPGDMVDRVLALLTGRRVDNSDASGG